MGVVLVPRVTVSGFEDVERQLRELAEQSTVDGICKRAVFVGAAEVLDETRSQLSALPVSNDPTKGVRADQKRGLLDGLGTADMRCTGGVWDTYTGVEGYNEHRTPSYPGGQPNPMIARSIENGSSVNPPFHPFAKAIRSARSRAVEAMRAQVEEDISKIANQ